MSKLSPRQKRHELTRQAILQAAKKIVAEEGVSALSMRAIADKIDYSPSGLYEYFGSKEDIISELSKEGFDRLGADLTQIDPTLSPSERLTEAGLVYLRFAASHPELYGLMFGHYSGHQPTIEEFKTHPVFEILTGIISEGAQKGEFDLNNQCETEALAFGCWAQVHGMAILREMLPGQHFDQASRLILQRQVLGLSKS